MDDDRTTEPENDDEAHELDTTTLVDLEPDGSSLLDRLKAKRRAIAERTTEEFVLPNNDGALGATYRILEWTEVADLDEKAAGSNNPEASLLAACDFLEKACVEVWLRDVEQSTPDRHVRQEWPGHDVDVRVRFDANLVGLLQLEDDLPPNATHRDIIRAALLRDLAVDAHQRFVLAWMQTGRKRADDEYLGE